jgi:hypothetical protein
MKTIRKYVMTDDVWDMLMDAFSKEIDNKLHLANGSDLDNAVSEIEEMHRLIDTVEVREEVDYFAPDEEVVA